MFVSISLLILSLTYLFSIVYIITRVIKSDKNDEDLWK